MGQIHLADRIVHSECDEGVTGTKTERPVLGRNGVAEIPENAVLFSDENGEGRFSDREVICTLQEAASAFCNSFFRYFDGFEMALTRR